MQNGVERQTPSWRFWGEEKVEGAIYYVYLKKVRYHPSSSINEDDEPDGIAHLEWETVKVKVIKGGTLEKLIESLALDTGELDTSFLTVFMSTYRTFATANEVLNVMFNRYKYLEENSELLDDELCSLHKKTIKTAVSVWLDSFYEDFHEPPHYENIQLIIDFAKHLGDSELEIKTRHRLKRFYKEDGLSDSPLIKRAVSSSHIPLENGDCSCMYDQAQPYISIFSIPNDLFAKQLTRIDADLFRKILPFHCLGSEWSKRSKLNGMKDSSVEATINQFNAVLFRVVSTILAKPEEPRLPERAKIITKWIDIAQEVRILKNFSSLKAIISALQSYPVHRLKAVWSYIAKEKIEIFNELAAIFSEDNNFNTCRTVLLREGTAKSAKTVGSNDKHLPKAILKQQSNLSTMQGTVPYLGTFLTDLLYIDAAYPDFLSPSKLGLESKKNLSDGSISSNSSSYSESDSLNNNSEIINNNHQENLINFDKRRKEFEVIAIIKMLQSATNNYNIDIDYSFLRWFDELEVSYEKINYEMSCRIEAFTNNNQEIVGKDKRPTLLKKTSFGQILGHKKNDSMASNSSALSSLSSASQSSNGSSPFILKERILSSSSSFSSLSSPSGISSSNSTPATTPDTPFKNSNFYIIRVALESINGSSSVNDSLSTISSIAGVNYKSIMVNNSDHTVTVIKNAMLKHGIEGNHEDYCLCQMLSEGEMIFPQNVNIYYALKNEEDLNFLLRLKLDEDKPGLKLYKNPKTRRKLLSTLR